MPRCAVGSAGRRAVREHGQPLIDDPARPGQVTAFGVDETAFLAATSTHPTPFATGTVDLARPRRRGPGRLGRPAAHRLAGRVRVAAFDPSRGYAAALTNGLPEAVRVLDAFHVTRLGLAALDDVRRRVQQRPSAGAGTAPARSTGSGAGCGGQPRA